MSSTTLARTGLVITTIVIIVDVSIVCRLTLFNGEDTVQKIRR